MKMLVPCSVLFLAGCQSANPPALAPAALPVLPVTPTVGEPVRAPERVQTYTVGAYIDPADPGIRHEAHQIQRIESPAHWRLAAAKQPETPAVTTVPLTDLPPPPAGSSVPTATSTPAAVAAPPALPEPALMPTADGIIDLADDAIDEANPFTVRKASPAVRRELSVQVGGIMQGAATQCALVNGRPLQPGDTWESLLVVKIETGAVLFRHGDQLLRIPVSRHPVRIQFAP